MIYYRFQGEIPPGVVQGIRWSKSGSVVTVEDGGTGLFPDDVLRNREQPLDVDVGDHVYKPKWTFTYWLNGQAITNFRWLVDLWLIRWFPFSLSAVFLLLNTIHGAICGGSAVRIAKRAISTTDKPRSLTKELIVLPIVAWIVWMVLVVVGLMFVSGCLYALFHRLLR